MKKTVQLAIILCGGFCVACSDDSLSRREAKNLLQAAFNQRESGATASMPAGRLYIPPRIEGEHYVSPSPNEECRELLQSRNKNRAPRDINYAFSDKMNWSLLQDSGLVLLNRGNDESGIFCDVGVSGRFRDAIVGPMVVPGDQSFPLQVTSYTVSEVTGISAPAPDAVGRRTSFVEYSYVETITPAGEILIAAGFVDRPDLGTHSGRATLVLFDDGWRVESLD
jgi:hypothetical protein